MHILGFLAKRKLVLAKGLIGNSYTESLDLDDREQSSQGFLAMQLHELV